MMRVQIEPKQQGVFSFASFSLDLPGGIGRATNSVGFHWASKENEEGKKVTSKARWKVVSSSPFIKLAFTRIPQGDDKS
jgi:hypothetical protein